VRGTEYVELEGVSHGSLSACCLLI
jgi:hypothetical protein